jgi:hypothetical protein
MGNHQSTTSVNVMQFLLGFLLALAVFLVELGVSQIILNNDKHCREVVQSGRLFSNPDDECLTEGIYYFMLALSRGPFASAHSNVPSIMAWMITGLMYGILGGFLATFTRKLAVGIFFGIHAMGLVILTLLAYLSNYIA